MALAEHPNLIYVDNIPHMNKKGDQKTYITVVKIDNRNEGEGALIRYRRNSSYGSGLIPYLRGKDPDFRVDFSDEVREGYIFYDSKLEQSYWYFSLEIIRSFSMFLPKKISNLK